MQKSTAYEAFNGGQRFLVAGKFRCALSTPQSLRGMDILKLVIAAETTSGAITFVGMSKRCHQGRGVSFQKAAPICSAATFLTTIGGIS